MNAITTAATTIATNNARIAEIEAELAKLATIAANEERIATIEAELARKAAERRNTDRRAWAEQATAELATAEQAIGRATPAPTVAVKPTMHSKAHRSAEQGSSETAATERKASAHATAERALAKLVAASAAAVRDREWAWLLDPKALVHAVPTAARAKQIVLTVDDLHCALDAAKVRACRVLLSKPDLQCYITRQALRFRWNSGKGGLDLWCDGPCDPGAAWAPRFERPAKAA